jgi:phosphoadenosine phosphosulfate reductase
MTTLDLAALNAELRTKTPQEIIQWALNLGKRTMLTTSFSPNAAVMLHLVSSIDASVPVVWIDSGYNLRDAYVVAERLMKELPLNMHIYTPTMTAERRTALMGIPSPDEPELHAEFTRQVKLEPFARAIETLKPEIWLTGIRRDETEFRKSLDILSWDNRGMLKVAPIFYWSEDEVVKYMEQYQLPTCKRYFDPTKVADHIECGLHTAA